MQEDDACVENRGRDGKATAAGRRGSEKEGERGKMAYIVSLVILDR